MRHGARWSIAAVILMVAAVIAIWPRSEPAPPPPEESTPTTANLTQARAQAALPACPSDAESLADLRDITVQCLADGTSADVAIKGPALVNMWATWCQPCKTELPILAEYAAQPAAVPVIGLAVESRPADALELLAALNVKLPSFLDEQGRAMRQLNVVALPATYFVDAAGSMTLIENPRLFRSVDEVTQAVADSAHG